MLCKCHTKSTIIFFFQIPLIVIVEECGMQKKTSPSDPIWCRNKMVLVIFLIHVWVPSIMEGTQHSGPRFTWSTGASLETKTFARLERALCNIQWSTEFTEARVMHLIQNQFNYSPLLISPNGFALISSMTKPFRFQQLG